MYEVGVRTNLALGVLGAAVCVGKLRHVEHTVAQELAEAVEDAGREVGGKHVVRLTGQVEDLQVWPLAPRHLELVQQAPRL